jgi:FkbM family methyltransferase
MNMPAALRAIRHTRLLERYEGLWNRVRPWYERSLRVVYGRRGMPITLRGGERIRVDVACRGFVWFGEDEIWDALMQELRPGDNFADVGANIGIYTIAAARRGARVTSYEPNPETAVLLRRNVALNGVSDRVTIHEVAVAATPGTLPFKSEGTLNWAARVDWAGGFDVQAATLEGSFDVVKIDVEGYELEVLKGAAPLLADHESRPRTIFLELHPERFAQDDDVGRSVRELLVGYGLIPLGARNHSDQWQRTEHWVARASD